MPSSRRALRASMHSSVRFFLKHLGAFRRRTPRARVGLKVPKDASHRDLSDAALRTYVWRVDVRVDVCADVCADVCIGRHVHDAFGRCGRLPNHVVHRTIRLRLRLAASPRECRAVGHEVHVGRKEFEHFFLAAVILVSALHGFGPLPRAIKRRPRPLRGASKSGTEKKTHEKKSVGI